MHDHEIQDLIHDTFQSIADTAKLGRKGTIAIGMLFSAGMVNVDTEKLLNAEVVCQLQTIVETANRALVKIGASPIELDIVID